MHFHSILWYLMEISLSLRFSGINICVENTKIDCRDLVCNTRKHFKRFLVG